MTTTPNSVDAARLPDLPDNDIDAEEIGKIIADCTVTFEDGFSRLDHDMFASVIRVAMEEYALAAIAAQQEKIQGHLAEGATCPVPDGWQLVPKVLTYPMAAAAYLAWDGFGESAVLGPVELLAVYKDMLAAAPATAEAGHG